MDFNGLFVFFYYTLFMLAMGYLTRMMYEKLLKNPKYSKKKPQKAT
jgi:hypothetical protein